MLEFFEPDTLGEALALGARFGSDANFVAGGTDLVIQMHRGRRDPRYLISLVRLRELAQIEAGVTRVTLGALSTHRDIERHAAFQGIMRGLVESAEVIGGHQVRNVGTVGGNICNASPAADLLPVLLALDARVHLQNERSKRDLPLAAFVEGPGRTARAPDEILLAVSFDRPAPASGTAFLKFGRRRAMEISIVSAAAVVTVDERGRCMDARIAVGAAAPTAIRAPAAEQQLRGGLVTAGALRAAGRAAADACSPLSDVRASSAYRRRLVETLVGRVVDKAIARASGHRE